MDNTSFLRRSAKIMLKKYVGWDWRLLPVLGFIGLIASAAVFWQYRWADALVFGVLLTLCVCWSLAVHDVWKDDCKDLVPFKELESKQKENFAKFVFPYIRSINASAIVCSNEDYLEISVYFPTSHLEEKELKLTGELILDGHTSKKLETKPCKITPDGVARIISWRVELTNTLLQHVKQKVETNSPVQATLKLQDINNREYSWETETWTTLLLTKTS